MFFRHEDMKTCFLDMKYMFFRHENMKYMFLDMKI